MMREPRKSLLRAAAGTVLVVAALLMSHGTALAKVTFRTVGSASDADHLIRRVPAVELVLQDGRVIEANDVRRDGGNYVVRLPTGETLTLPVEIVKTVRLTARGPFTSAEPRVVGGQAPPAGPSGLRVAEPETLAGRPVRPPTRSEQLETLGSPARFQRDIVDNRWTPKSDWDMDPVKGNNFNPSTWAKGPIDPNWQPESAWDPNSDMLAPSRSTWQKSNIDSTWTPTDAFAKKDDRS